MLLRSRRRVASVPRRRSRAGPDRLAALPEEILQDILLRPPANSVLRRRAVCRLWRRLASDPAFLLNHHRRQPELALIRSYQASDASDALPRLEALHIRADEFRYHRILAFHTVAETFQHMSPPAAVEPRHAMYLLEMGGKLAASINKDDMTGLTIFVLQDQEHDVWTYHYQIKLPVMDNMHFQREQGNCWAKIVSEEQDLLVSCYGHLLQCDKKGNLVANFKFHDDMPVVVPHRLKESLIQHKFFQMKKTPEEEEEEKSITMVILEI